MQTDTRTQSPLSKQTIAAIFKVMATRFQALWLPKAKSQRDLEAAMGIWHRDLSLLGVTDASAKLGMARAAALKFGPVPSEFAELCRPSRAEMGIPVEAEAYLKMVEVVGRWGFTRPELFPHPTVEMAARQIGSHVLRHSTDRQLRALFAKTYAEIVTRALRGDLAPTSQQPALTKPAQPPKAATTQAQRRAKAQRWKDEVMSQLGSVSQ